MSDVSQFDAWLTTDEFAALVIREFLEPVEGPDGVLFPATYAAAEDKKVFPGGYNIDPPEGDKNICLVDSIGSQANRIEPMFAKPDFAHLIPQISVTAGPKSISILEAGHRAGDALVRCTPLQKELQDAFKSVLKGDAEPMAKIAPTSLVFGVWDSRDTQAKLPRLIASTIRAFDVKRLKRSAQYNPSTDYIGDNLLPETTDKSQKDAYAERGFVHVPATGSHGGVIASGGVRRDATLSLGALRLLSAGSDPKKTVTLRRYVLGLSLVAFTSNPATYLRQGCNLVPGSKPREFELVHADGKREPLKLTNAEALKYATAVAKAFGVGEGKTVTFDSKLASADIKGEGDVKPTRSRGRRNAATADTTEGAE
ncbi:type I-G CRISPR-associated RAMP protein Csb1/Cas7g [Schlesneria paludicola]|uniref:type I-G CRISPR-associated RAMP protein Csb1/Cas7g n=1 Tax=Schlesneria paludicola TaxID=360056 RepID=UPI00029B4993|nr:type I-U CRISPR-associated RAMP protein Csb1/Cas7u [Schlesneria paludicola]